MKNIAFFYFVFLSFFLNAIDISSDDFHVKKKSTLIFKNNTSILSDFCKIFCHKLIFSKEKNELKLYSDSNKMIHGSLFYNNFSLYIQCEFAKFNLIENPSFTAQSLYDNITLLQLINITTSFYHNVTDEPILVSTNYLSINNLKKEIYLKDNILINYNETILNTDNIFINFLIPSQLRILCMGNNKIEINPHQVTLKNKGKIYLIEEKNKIILCPNVDEKIFLYNPFIYIEAKDCVINYQKNCNKKRIIKNIKFKEDVYIYYKKDNDNYYIKADYINYKISTNELVLKKCKNPILLWKNNEEIKIKTKKIYLKIERLNQLDEKIKEHLLNF